MATLVIPSPHCYGLYFMAEKMAIDFCIKKHSHVNVVSYGHIYSPKQYNPLKFHPTKLRKQKL